MASLQSSFYGATLGVAYYFYLKNPQIVYQNLVNKAGIAYVFVVPCLIALNLYRGQNKANDIVYQKVVGGLSD